LTFILSNQLVPLWGWQIQNLQVDQQAGDLGKAGSKSKSKSKHCLLASFPPLTSLTPGGHRSFSLKAFDWLMKLTSRRVIGFTQFICLNVNCISKLPLQQHPA
jgi:hypothetical protein